MNFKISRPPLKCGSHEAESREYEVVKGKGKRLWLIAIQENSADNIYHWQPGPSDGFGGRAITFKLKNGDVLKLQGPWHGNANDLFEDTKVDVRNKYLTFGVISKEVEWDYGNPTMKDVIYKDKDWTVGVFDRIENLAQTLADSIGVKVYYYFASTGGSMLCSVQPTKGAHSCTQQ